MVSLDIHHTSLRANGRAIEMTEDFPFVLSFVEALLSFSTAC